MLAAVPAGPFDLLHQNGFFNGWPTLAGDGSTIVMTFPVEGWSGSAAVTMSQDADGAIRGRVFGTADPDLAWGQALAALSLDEDGAGWPAVGERDPIVGRLQHQYRMLRPTLFHSPYEAAAHFVIGHRISVVQARRYRARLSETSGAAVDVDGQTFHAFPAPRQLLGLESIPGLSQIKVQRLHAVARGALDGLLDRTSLRSLPEPTALAALKELPGVGDFFAQGILYRGAGVRDGLTTDDFSVAAIAASHPDDARSATEIADAWRPYRMWATVLTHVWARENDVLAESMARGRPRSR